MPDHRKLLSVHEADVRVLVRGKAGREVEFGNTLLLAECPQGLILDWELYREKAPAEWRQLQQSVQRQTAFDLSADIVAVGADRGFCARKGSEELAQRGIYDAVCPKDPAQLRERFAEKRFAGLQRRRGSTEARIAIVKQRQKRRLRSRGFAHRYLAVAWSVLGHNLWLIARLLCDQQKIAEAA